MEEKLSWKEKFSATIVLLISIIFLAAQVASILSSRSENYTVQNGSVQINKSDLFADIRSYLTIFVGFAGAILLFKKRRLGWMIGLPVITLFGFVAGTLLMIWRDLPTIEVALIATTFAILLLAFLFLLLPSARKKYKVGKSAVLPTLVFLILLSAVYFFLQ